MQSRTFGIFAVLLALVLTGAAPAQTGIPGLDALKGPAKKQSTGMSSDRAQATLLVNATQVTPGSDVVAAIVLTVDPGWHVRPRATGPTDPELEYATKFTVGAAPAGVVIHRDFAQWPTAHDVVMAGGVESPAYDGTVAIFVPLTIDANATTGPRTLEFAVSVQSCDDKTCLKLATLDVSTALEIVAAGTTTASSPDAIFKQFDSDAFRRIRAGEKAPQIVNFGVFGWNFSIDSRGAGFIALLLIAAIGGFLLNLTPCVLPVIPLKILSLSSAAGTRRRTLFLGMVMSFGVIAFWMALGVAVKSIEGFTSANQLFQYPWFVIGVGAFIAVMSIGLLGFFNVGLPQWVYMINPKKDSASGSFGFGIMTAVLSTPCTAPLMGAAIAWAATQSTATVLAVFAAVGIGMAFPYMVLAAFPQLTKRVPKSGPASELIKQVMALLLLAAAAFFVGAGVSGLLVNPPDPPSKLYWWVVAAAALIAGGWMLVRTLQITPRLGRRVFFGGIATFIMAVAILIGFTQTAKGPIAWTYYTPDRLASAKKQGDVVVIDFTAEWCLNCKTLEATVLNLPSIAKELNGIGVSAIKVDLTGNNTPGNELLKSFDRITIPLLVVLDRSGNEVFRSDTYGPQQVRDALEKARGAQATPAAGVLGGS